VTVFRPKLIAVDLDGTLLNGEGMVTERTALALRRAMEQGINVIIATGRMYSSALPTIRKLGIQSPCVFYNGALVRDPAAGRVYYEKGLGAELTAEVMDFYHSRGWYIQVYSDDRLYVLDDNDPRCKFYENIAKIDALALKDKFWDFRVDSIKLLGIAECKEDFKEMFNETKARFTGKLYTTTSWGAFVEMVHPDVNKARGLEIAARQMGIPRSAIAAVGDSLNDKEMISWAGVGVAMGNALDEVKAAADEIVSDNDHDGVAEAIEKFLTQA